MVDVKAIYGGALTDLTKLISGDHPIRGRNFVVVSYKLNSTQSPFCHHTLNLPQINASYSI